MICFLGSSYAALTLKEGARRRGLELSEHVENASLVFVSEDTPTDEYGVRELGKIEYMVGKVGRACVVTSQVPPGWMREHALGCYHQAETLRIEDGVQRAMYPEMFIVGYKDANFKLPGAYQHYLDAFDCPVFKMDYESAEFAKIAINATLISQVETTNMLAAAAQKAGANWQRISQALRHDSRIGRYSYLTPGRWQNSRHLMRDYVSLADITPSKLLEAWR